MGIAGENRKLILNGLGWVMGFLFSILVGSISVQLSYFRDDFKDLSKNVGAVNVSIAEVKKELDTVKPRDVLEAVHQTARDMVTREELRAAIRDTAPWANDREQWERWRERTDERINKIEAGRK